MNFKQKYILCKDYGIRETAGSKAPNDIEQILIEDSFKKIYIQNLLDIKKSKLKIHLLKKAFIIQKDWSNIIKNVEQNSLVVLQFPLNGEQMVIKYINKLKYKKNCTVVAIIHDLDSLRKGIYSYNEERSEFADNDFLKACSYVICHNEKMKEYLIGKGFDGDKLIPLEIFDYLVTGKVEYSTHDMKPQKNIVIAGNLTIHKSKYLYELDKIKQKDHIQLKLFGIGYDGNTSDFVEYLGKFPPDTLPNTLTKYGDFGLVWDGESIESCVGDIGEYLKYINPHKTSLYLVSGIPVIIWSGSAMAKFISDEKLGIVVDSLHDIDNKLANLTEDEYIDMKKNTQQISAKLQDGYFIRKALEKIDIML